MGCGLWVLVLCCYAVLALAVELSERLRRLRAGRCLTALSALVCSKQLVKSQQSVQLPSPHTSKSHQPNSSTLSITPTPGGCWCVPLLSPAVYLHLSVPTASRGGFLQPIGQTCAR